MDENDDDSVIAQLNRITFKQYVEQGIIRTGMIPKLENAFEAIDAGVKQVIITNASEIHSNTGTHIVNH
jgi:acetylglutamate kinase